MLNTSDIDIVITWVDGACRKHQAKRAIHTPADLKGAAVSPLRWRQNNEILYCLRSIELYAPWVRRIFIVTDDQAPPLFVLSEDFRRKVSIVDHSVIFRGYERWLPTFNSVSIATAIHRIPGLGERFLLFNDDVFFTNPVKPADFFDGDQMIIRGVMGGELTEGMQFTTQRRNTAALLGVGAANIFRTAHVCIPMLRSLTERFLAEREGLFEANIRHRFRCDSQFLVSTLNTHLAIAQGRARIYPGVDWQFVTAIICQSMDAREVRRSMRRVRSSRVKMACVNDLASAMEAWPKAEKAMARAVERSMLRGFVLHRAINHSPGYMRYLRRSAL